jgi:hypothetical protein
MPSSSKKRKRKRIATGRKDAESARLLATEQKELDERRETLRKVENAEFLESLEGRSRITKGE